MSDINAITNGLRALAERVENIAKPEPAPQLPTLTQLNAFYVRSVVALHHGNKSAASRALDIDIRTLNRWLNLKVA